MGVIRNKVKRIIDASGETRYAWAKKLKVGNKTIYGLYADPSKYLDAETLAAFCSQGCRIDDVLEYLEL
jgi:Cro/C1-type HTH DNA-binding domain